MKNASPGKELILVYSRDFSNRHRGHLRAEHFDEILFLIFPDSEYDSCPRAKAYRDIFIACKKYAAQTNSAITSFITGTSATIAIKAESIIFRNEYIPNILTLVAKYGRSVIIIPDEGQDEVTLRIHMDVEKAFSFCASKVKNFDFENM